MKKLIQPWACLFLLLSVSCAQANDDAASLVHNCKELVSIYAKRDEQRLLAGVSTSVSSALRAGRCIGVLDEYRRHSGCATSDWFIQAQRIAATPRLGYDEAIDIESLLEKSCAQ